VAYDPSRQRVVLFGGFAGAGPSPYLNDTWEWDGSNWTQLFPATSPSPRNLYGLAYDPLRRKVLLFGGYNSPSVHGDTWEWDGVNWTQMVTSSAPSARAGHAMTADSLRGRLVLHGGYSPASSSIALQDTWEWDGFAATWSQRSSIGGPKRTGHGLVFDSVRGQSVMFGGVVNDLVGLADTWVYSPVNSAGFTSYGAGCASIFGVPTISADALPWLGTTLSGNVANLGAGATALMLGDSKATWGPVPLPLDLGSFGMPGCSLYANPLVSMGLVNTSGTAPWSIPIPGIASYAGVSLYTQAAVVALGTNPTGVVTSNACELKLGSK